MRSRNKKVVNSKKVQIIISYSHVTMIMFTHPTELERTNREMAVLKKLAANNEAEYDRLAKENQKLQVHIVS